MKLTIKATNFKLSPAIYTYIDQKLGSLDRFIQHVDFSLVEGWVEVGKTTKHHRGGDVFRAEAQIRLPGKGIRAEAEEVDLHIAIDRVKDELQRELKKYKGKLEAKYKRGARRAKRAIKIAPEARFLRKGRIRSESL